MDYNTNQLGINLSKKLRHFLPDYIEFHFGISFFFKSIVESISVEQFYFACLAIYQISNPDYFKTKKPPVSGELFLKPIIYFLNSAHSCYQSIPTKY
jgi:hypothetical protein